MRRRSTTASARATAAAGDVRRRRPLRARERVVLRRRRSALVGASVGAGSRASLDRRRRRALRRRRQRVAHAARGAVRAPAPRRRRAGGGLHARPGRGLGPDGAPRADWPRRIRQLRAREKLAAIEAMLPPHLPHPLLTVWSEEWQQYGWYQQWSANLTARAAPLSHALVVKGCGHRGLCDAGPLCCRTAISYCATRSALRPTTTHATNSVAGFLRTRESSMVTSPSSKRWPASRLTSVATAELASPCDTLGQYRTHNAHRAVLSSAETPTHEPEGGTGGADLTVGSAAITPDATVLSGVWPGRATRRDGTL